VLRLPDEGRSPQDLARTLIDTPAGRIPVSAIATVSETDGPNQIGRENGRRRIVVYANTDGSDMSRIVRDIRAAIDRTQLPTGNSISGRSVPGSGAGCAEDCVAIADVSGIGVPGALHATAPRRWP
jgi:Cu/Ag efflux pump CusA